MHKNFLRAKDTQALLKSWSAGELENPEEPRVNRSEALSMEPITFTELPSVPAEPEVAEVEAQEESLPEDHPALQAAVEQTTKKEGFSRLLREPQEITGLQKAHFADISTFEVYDPDSNHPGSDRLHRSQVSSTAVLQAQTESEQLLEEARAEAVKILVEAQNAAEQVRQQAYDEGMTAARTEAAEFVQLSRKTYEEAQAWSERLMSESEPAIIHTILAIVQMIFGEGATVTAGLMEQLISRALAEAGRLGNMRVFLNPADVELMYSLWQDNETTVNGQHIQLMSNPNILRGGCFIEGDFGSVDARIQTQLHKVKDTLMVSLSNREEEIHS